MCQPVCSFSPATGRVHFTPFWMQHFTGIYFKTAARFTDRINLINLTVSCYIYFVWFIFHKITSRQPNLNWVRLISSKAKADGIECQSKVFLRTPAPFHTKPQGLKSGWRWSEFSFDRPSIDPYFNDQEGEKPFSPTVALSTQLPNLLLAPACCGGLSIWSNSCRNQHHRHHQKHPTRTAEWVKIGSYVGGYEE